VGYRWISDRAEPACRPGIECTVFEQSGSIRELGVGINVPLNGHRLAHGQPGYEIKIN
jgi:hypothetical protein